MKRILALVLCLCLVLAGCGGAAPAETTAASTTAITESPTEAITELVTTAATEPEPEEPTLEEVVVYDDGTFKLTAKEIDFTDKYSFKIKMLAENNSDQNVVFGSTYFTVNGITTIGSMYIKVAAGKKANDYISLDRNRLGNIGIDTIATVVVPDANIVDTDTFKTITEYAFDLKTSIADSYIQTIDKSGQTVYSEGDITIKYRGVSSDSLGKEQLDFYIENTGNQSVNVMVKDSSLNGFTLPGAMCARAFANSCLYDQATFLTKDMEANDITTIENVTIRLYACDSKTYKTLWTTDEIELAREYSDDSEAEETAAATGDSNTGVTSKEPVLDNDNLLILIKGTMIKNHSDVDVKLDGKTVVATYTQQGIAQAIPFITAGNQELLKSWNGLAEATRKECETGWDLVKGCGYDYSFKIILLNDLDTSKSLLECTDGEITYNVVEAK